MKVVVQEVLGVAAEAEEAAEEMVVREQKVEAEVVDLKEQEVEEVRKQKAEGIIELEKQEGVVREHEVE